MSKVNLITMMLLSVLMITGCAGTTSQDTATVVQEPPAEKATIYSNVALVDGTGAPLKKSMSILVRGATIEAILSQSEMDRMRSDDITLVDGTGWYAVPGLIDSHVHMATLPNDRQAKAIMRRYLYSGITSVRDMAGDGRALMNLSRRTHLKEIDAPDLYYSALMAGPSFFVDPRPAMSAQGEEPGHVPWMQAITPETDMPQAVALARGTWATGIKIYANLDVEEVRRIARESKKQGIKVWSHSMVFPAFPNEVVEAGVDVISHVCRLAFEISQEKPTEYHHKVIPDYANLNPRHEKIKAIFLSMKDQDIVLDATVWLYAELERMKRENPEVKTIPVNCPADFAGRLTAFAHELGVDISTGTDGATPYDAAYPALYEELDVLQDKVGMSPLQIIRSASIVGAKTLGIEQDTGTLEVGKKADIVFVTQNPLQDISNLRSVILTVKGGTEYRRSNYQKLTKEEMNE